MSMNIPQSEIVHRFTYHPPTDAKIQYHATIRSECARLAMTLQELLPVSRESSLAMTKLEEVMFWANAAIARNQV